MANAESLGYNLACERRAVGLTQAELAELSGVNVRSIRAYEQGQKDISKASVATVMAIANALNVPIEALIYGITAVRF